MKQLYAMLLGLGMSATCAMSQNVTVFMKDNTTHKYSAEYLSEISFRDVTPGPETVEFSNVNLDVYSGGNVTVTLTNEAGDVECKTDLYGSATALFLEAGVYTVDNGSLDPFTVDPAYSGVTIEGTRHTITSGNVSVAYGPEQTSSIFREASADHQYRIAVDLTLDNGENFKGTFKGELPKYTPWINAVLSAASYNTNPQPAGQFYVKFNDANWNYEMAMIFAADPEAKTLPAGTYTLSDFANPGSLLSASYVDGYRPNFNAKLAEGSVVTVTETDGVYDIKMNLKLDDGREATFTFNGEITGTPTFEVPSIECPKLEMDVWGSGNVTLAFYTEDNAINISLDTYQDPNATYFQPGVYTIGANEVPYIDTNPSYTFFCTADESDTPVKTAFKSGTLTVTREDAVYTFLLDAVLENDQTIRMTSTTELPKFGPIVNLTMTSAAYLPLENPAKGNVYVKFSDSTTDAEMALDIWYYPFSGNKLWGSDDPLKFKEEPGTPLTFSGKSYLDMFRPNSNNKFLDGSTVLIQDSDNGYKFTMQLLLQDGRTANVTYDGPVTGNPVAETVETVECTKIDMSLYGGGTNITFVFSTEDDQTKIQLDTYNDAATYFQPGVYTIGANTNPRIDDSINWTYYQKGDEKVGFQSGTLTVTLNEDVYTFVLDAVLSNGDPIKMTCTSELPQFGPTINLTMSAASYFPLENPAKGNVRVKLHDANYSAEMSLDLWYYPFSGNQLFGSDDKLIFKEEPGTPLTFSGLSYLDLFNPNSNNKFVDGSTVLIQDSENGYKFTMHLLLQDGRIANVTYDGPVTGNPVAETVKTVECTKIDMTLYGGGTNITFVFSTEDEQTKIQLDTYNDAASYFQPGVYTIGANTNPKIDSSINWSYYQTGDEKVGFQSGTLTVTRDGDVYTFVLDAVLSNDEPIKMTCTTQLPKFGPTINLTMSAASFFPLTNPEKGNVRVKLHDADYSAEMSLDLWYYPFSGNQLWGSDDVLNFKEEPGTPLTFSGLSYLDLFNPNSNNKFLDGSTVLIQDSGDGYKFTMHLLLQDGRIANVTYEGPVTGNPVAQESAPIECTRVEVVPAMGGHVTLTFFTEDNQTEIKLDTYNTVSLTEQYFRPGVYTFGVDRPYISVNNSYYKTNGNEVKFESGSMNVTLDGTIYTFVLDAVLEGGTPVKMNCTTALPTYGPSGAPTKK